MPHRIEWLVENRVLLTTLYGAITFEEFSELIDTLMLKFQKGAPVVHHISNSLGMERVEFPLRTLQTLPRAKKMAELPGWQIDINRNPLAKLFASMAAPFSSTRNRTFATADEAVEFLKETDQTLASLEWKMYLLKADETISFRKR